MNESERIILKLKIDIATLRGTFIGVLEGILYYKIEDELRDKIQNFIIEMRQEDK